MTDSQAAANLAAVVEQLRRYVPIIAPYFTDGTTLGEHSARLRAGMPHPVHAARQEMLARAARRVSAQAFGIGSWATGITAADLRAVNIVDHHQLLNHPLLLGTNVIADVSRLLGDPGNRPIVTFSCSNIAPGNYYLRNGFRFRGHQVAYFSAREYRDVIYYAPHRTFDFVERLRKAGRWTGFGPGDQNFLGDYQRLLNGLDYTHCARHKDQLAVALRATWPMLFRTAVPELLYLNAEDVTRHLLIELLGSENHIADAILEPGLRGDVLDTFRGIVVAWDEQAGKGTHFFWRRHPTRPRLLRMYVRGNELVPADPRFAHLAVPLERAALIDHLRSEDLIPAVSLHVSLFLYAGVRPLVGPGSLVYFTDFKAGWAKVLSRHGLTAEADLVSAVDTGGLIAGAPIFFERRGPELKTLYATDVMGNGGVDADYLRSVLTAPLRDVLSVGATGVYDLFANSYIPADQHMAARLGFDEAATLVHQWI